MSSFDLLCTLGVNGEIAAILILVFFCTLGIGVWTGIGLSTIATSFAGCAVG
jgi:hypothetical protein